MVSIKHAFWDTTLDGLFKIAFWDITWVVSLFCRFGKNRVVIRRGDIGYQYYYVYSGKVHITYATRGHQLYSKGASLKTLQRGDSFGVCNCILCFLRGLPCSRHTGTSQVIEK